MEGCQVEITYTNNRFKKVWYSATIELEPQTKPKSRFRQRCVRVLKDDSLTPLTIKEGSIVDADHNDEWWVCLVLKQVGDDKFLVLFDSPSDIVLFKREQLRVHLDLVDETWWVLPGRNVQFLRQLHEKPMFISGAMVEVSDKIDKGEVVWVPAIIIKEIHDDDSDEKKYFVKKRPNKKVNMRSIRPRPPPFSAEELKLVEYVEVFHGTSWRQGRAIGRVFRGRCKVLS
uniref:Agenet domain-containing protein n=1 Tax=Brassica oleracea TaxID=3712 RepID=A0A3P6DVR9_BRAOL|nr:unnamed protein product [Brassica oleracea]